MRSDAYFLAKFRFDTAENEPAKSLVIFPILLTLPRRRGPHAESVAAAEVANRANEDELFVSNFAAAEKTASSAVQAGPPRCGSE